MGCDIHCYIEHARRPSADGRVFWSAFGGRINPGRDYRMFGVLAGVRSDDQPMFALRGLPEKHSLTVLWDNQYYVSDNGAEDRETVTREKAESWVASGHSEWTDDAKRAVTNPDWHSHSWLTLDEWKAALAAGGDPEWGPPAIEYHAITAVMQTFADAGEQTRIVFWFDN